MLIGHQYDVEIEYFISTNTLLIKTPLNFWILPMFTFKFYFQTKWFLLASLIESLLAITDHVQQEHDDTTQACRMTSVIINRSMGWMSSVAMLIGARKFSAAHCLQDPERAGFVAKKNLTFLETKTWANLYQEARHMPTKVVP